MNIVMICQFLTGLEGYDEPLHFSQQNGYQLDNSQLIITSSSSTQPDWYVFIILRDDFPSYCKKQYQSPQCSYHFKPAYKDGYKMKPNSAPCPVCGFDFVVFQQCNFEFGEYCNRLANMPFTRLRPQIPKFVNDTVYSQIWRK